MSFYDDFLGEEIPFGDYKDEAADYCFDDDNFDDDDDEREDITDYML